jgi:hypothetical protein
MFNSSAIIKTPETSIPKPLSIAAAPAVKLPPYDPSKVEKVVIATKM